MLIKQNIFFILCIILCLGNACSTNTSKKKLQKIALVEVLQSSIADQFQLQFPIFQQSFVGIPAQQLPIFNAHYFSSNIGHPHFFPAQLQLSTTHDTTVTLQSISTKSDARSVLETLQYGADGYAKNYYVRDASQEYQCTFSYNALNQVDLIFEQDAKTQLQYNELGNLTAIFLLDQQNQVITKDTIIYHTVSFTNGL
jgi:YD repeat-containing protein